MHRRIIVKNTDPSDESHSIHYEHKYLKSLWRAAVLQALRDIYLRPTNKKNRSARNKALRWLNIDDNDFIETCYLAEFDPVKVIAIAKSGVSLSAHGIKFMDW